ncbi:UNVERIFIED_CONTAM: hypothetical protein Sradi_1638200 [Sesamum radiatum]|uniref:RNase H type-1 domain-containing protein n=1 Tax=Sesamum radiatum TaxID=300843 RepID=A0AAW2UBT2_SESRA
MINALIFLNAEPRPWQFTGVHCPAVSVLKPIFWHSFNEICHSFDGPWLAMGDFNAVMSQTEKRGGKPFASASRNALGNEFDVCNLIDLGFTGASFTWSNKRPAPSRYSVRSLPPPFGYPPSNRNRPKPFFFEDMWCRDFSCETLIADVWLSYVSGNPILRLHNLLKLLRGELRKWNRRTFGWCQERISSIKQHLETLQESAQTVEVIEMENNLQLELDEQLKRVETKWKQKAKQRWLEDGDANTKYFHMTAVLQSRANHIHSIQTREGNAVTDWELIGNEFSAYFQSLFKSDLSQNQTDQMEFVCELMPSTISEFDNQDLCRIPSPKEIKDTLFDMASFKSPGPDGFPPNFFKQFWHIVGPRMIDATRHFFSSGQICPAINHTFITLIPKSPKASTVEQFRPISLCNTTYKEKRKKRCMAIKIDLTKAYDRVEWPLLINLLKSVGICNDFVNWVKGASWIWQDAVKCMEIIQLGACFPVSKQSVIKIWEQPWIPSIQNYIPDCPQDPNPNWPTLVRDLIDQNCNQWKLELLNQMFPWNVVKEIRKIQIPETTEPPRPFWAPSKSGKFSTKAAFHAIQQITTQDDPDAEVLGKRIWSLDLHNRLKIFIWRTLFDTETAHHLFLCCPFSEKIWMLSKWQLRLHPISHLSLREWFLEISSKNASFFPDNNIQNEFIIAWAITLELTWKARNDLVHGNEAQNPEQVAQSVLRNTLAHSEARISKKAKPQTNCDWQPPPMNWIKVNCDIALKDDKCFAAFIARDHQSFLIRAETAEIFVYDASFAELRAIRLAAEKFHAKNEDRVIFESDSTEAIKWIKSKSEDVDRAAILDSQAIRRIWECRPNWDFRHIPRLCNSFAHGISKWAHGANWDGPVPPPF